MPLTDADRILVRMEIGSAEPPTDGDLDDAFDRLLSWEAVAREVLAIRLADLLASPATFSVSGVYSQSTGDNIRSLQAQLTKLESAIPGGPDQVVISSPDVPCGR